MRKLVFLTVLAGGAAAAPAQAAEDLERGRYLVERVGMCGDCHSPRDARGEYISARWLHGAAIEVAPRHPMPAWAEVAPPLAGLPPGYTAVQLATFLESGRRPDGTMPRAPMPAYRFSAQDASAVASYLASLPRP